MPTEVVRKHEECGCIEIKGWHQTPTYNWVVQVTSDLWPEPSIVMVEAESEILAVTGARAVLPSELLGLRFRVVSVETTLKGCCRDRDKCLRCQEAPTTDDLVDLAKTLGLI
ncbi:hypothetical protein [Streptomyces sp. NPDC048489]|uniref:hypothetical protein n=1 Tax=Streptomyces sp. NPDC048489 TaxID=3154504 RepID=UPI00343AFE3E